MFEIDTSLPWTEHLVSYGFAVRPGLIDRQWCAAAVAAMRSVLDDQRPLTEWTVDDPGTRYTVFYQGEQPDLDSVYDQGPLVDALDELFGDRGARYASADPSNPQRRHHAFWLKPYDPAGRRRPTALGHIDSGSPWRGLAVYVALADSEPWGGNTILFPGTHLLGHERMLTDPPADFAGGMASDIPQPYPPYEFVARAGDVAFVHHLTYHTGVDNSADGRSPRMAVRLEAFARRPLIDLDPGRVAAPWEQSFRVTKPTGLPPGHLATL